MSIEFIKIYNDAKIPTRATKTSAGLDIYAHIPNGSTIVKKGGTAFINTGIILQLKEPDTVGLVYARSGLAVKYGLNLVNSVGVIDSDYRGEIKIGLINFGNGDYTINNGDRIAQLVVTKVSLDEPLEVFTVDKTERGGNGFGSTGIN